ncbi:MAG: hypothetical protein FJ145_23005 [Deltaproteobacteria bacterium]|nr:hypothetical protein [Deltaproteobacteria bacterium]
MRRTKKILIPDVPPKRRTMGFQNLRNWLRLSLRAKPILLTEQSPATVEAKASRPVQVKPLTTDH